jgi:ankyrin repeat protein
MRLSTLLRAIAPFLFGVGHAANSSLPPGAIEAPAIVYWSSLGRVETVRKLLAEKANPSSTDSDGWSALQAAAENGHIEIVKLLIAAGADLNYSGVGGTALQLAIKSKQEEIAKFLRQAGAK